MRIRNLGLVVMMAGVWGGMALGADTVKADDPGLAARVAVKFEKEFKGPAGGVSVVGISADGKVVALSGLDKKIHLINCGTGQEMRVLEGTGKVVVSMVFSPDGKYLLAQDWEK